MRMVLESLPRGRTEDGLDFDVVDVFVCTRPLSHSHTKTINIVLSRMKPSTVAPMGSVVGLLHILALLTVVLSATRVGATPRNRFGRPIANTQPQPQHRRGRIPLPFQLSTTAVALRTRIITLKERERSSSLVVLNQKWPTLMIPRGGAIVRNDDKEIESTNNGGGGLVEATLQSLFRCLLRQTKHSSFLYNTVSSACKLVESFTGYRLMPRLPAKKKRKKLAQPNKSEQKKQNKNIKLVTDAEQAEQSQQRKKQASSPTTASSTSERAKKKRKSNARSKIASSAIAKPSATTTMHSTKALKSTNPNYRIQQELKTFLNDPPQHLSVATGKNIRIWIVTVQGIGIYKGETFRLRIQFPASYPTVPPSVYFLPPHIPLHEHVYTNGDICLSLLGKDWRPTMTAQSIAHSILSILASANSKSLPMDNARHAQNQPGQYQADWVYHDDNC